jgi:hypothetical protein
MTRYRRTQTAAKEDRLSRWHLIEAIAKDADEADLAITGIDSRLAAKDACEAAGLELADHTIKALCTTAKFDFESTVKQRRIWRRYGWSIVMSVANAGWSPEAAADLLGDEHLSQREVLVALGRRIDSTAQLPLDDAWAAWGNQFQTLMIHGARLAERTEKHRGKLGAHAELFFMFYQRFTERQIDAELRQMLENAS